MRRRLWTVALIVLVTGSLPACRSPVRERVVLQTVVDFSAYSAEGFLITPDPYWDTYESLGVVEVVVYPKAWVVSVSTYGGRRIETEGGSLELALSLAVEEARALGADALVRFESRIVPEQWREADYYSVRLSGLAIRRHDARP